VRSRNIAIIDKSIHFDDKFSINVIVLYVVNIYVAIEANYKHLFELESLLEWEDR